MSQTESWPERIDLASLVGARKSLQAALGRLEKGSVSDSDVAAIRMALRELSILASDRLWTPLETAARRLHQTTAAPPRDSADAGASRELVEALLAEATSSPRPATHEPDEADEVGRALGAARIQVQIFVNTAQRFADQPAPVENAKDRVEWIKAAKAILEKAVDLVTNIAVAAAFTVSAVQLAAQRAVIGAADLAEQAASRIGPMLPSLLALTVVAAQASMGVKLLRDMGQPIDPAGPRQAAEQPDHLDPAAPTPPARTQDEARAAFRSKVYERVDQLEAEETAQRQANRLGPAERTTRRVLRGETWEPGRSASHPADVHKPVDKSQPTTEMSPERDQDMLTYLEEEFPSADDEIAAKSTELDQDPLVVGEVDPNSGVVIDEIPGKIDPTDPRQSRADRELPPDAASPF